MIYITGDTHSDFTRFIEEQFPVQNEMTKKDYILKRLSNGLFTRDI